MMVTCLGNLITVEDLGVWQGVEGEQTCMSIEGSRSVPGRVSIAAVCVHASNKSTREQADGDKPAIGQAIYLAAPHQVSIN